MWLFGNMPGVCAEGCIGEFSYKYPRLYTIAFGSEASKTRGWLWEEHHGSMYKLLFIALKCRESDFFFMLIEN